MPRYIVDGHCVMDTKTTSPSSGMLCVADCLDPDWVNNLGHMPEASARINAARIAHLLNTERKQLHTWFGEDHK